MQKEFPDVGLEKEGIRTALKETEVYKAWQAQRNKGIQNQKTDELVQTSVTLDKGDTQTSEGWVKTYQKEKLKDESFLLQLHGYDPLVWEICYAKSSIWQAGVKDAREDGKAELNVCDLYSSKITVRKLREVNEAIAIDWFKALHKSYRPPALPKYKPIKSNKILEINIADLHYGKLAWRGDTGEDYDHKIARKRFFKIINDIISKTKGYQFEKIIFVWCNDFFHFDTINNTTTKGTQLEADVRWKKLYQKGTQMLIEGIDIIKQAFECPVETFYIASNHDTMTAFYAVELLAAWYRNDKNVIVNNTNTRDRKYIEYGNCLIGFDHGSSMPKKRIGKMMPMEAREAWGRTKYHEMHIAHYHSEQTTKEENGTIVRAISSPTGTDNYHYVSGFIGAVKKAEHFIWDKKTGLDQIIMTPVA